MNKLEVDAVQANGTEGDTAVAVFPTLQSGLFSAEQYADQLMDDLFLGLEQSLESGELLEEPPEQEAIAVEILETPASSELSVVEQTDLKNQALDKPVSTETDSSVESEAAAQPDWSLRFLWAAALVSCIGATALCVTNWSSYKALFQKFTTEPAGLTSAAADVVTTTPNSTDQTFATYIQQSLDALALQSSSTSADLSAPVVAAALPIQTPAPAIAPSAPTAPGGIATAPLPPGSQPTAPTTILERVYIPVYQTPQGFVPVVPGVEAPNLSAASASSLTTGSTTAAPVVVPSAQIASSSTSANSTVATPPPAPTDQQQPTEPIAIQPIATAEQTLVGLLELGDSSAALFEESGVTRRFSLGERIGASGWTLVDVSNSEAIVRRNGELRSVFVGQTF